MILDHLHPVLEIDHQGRQNSGRNLNELPVTAHAIGQLRKTCRQIPHDYLEIIAQIDGCSVAYKTRSRYVFSPYIRSALEVANYLVGSYPFLFRHLPDCFFFVQEDDSYFLGENQESSGVYRVETSVAK